ncbi:shikimate kinase AroL [Tatumella sp. TA1]|uniref:shikimate kinase AroL n=1 Tax=Rosenbergiella collisarenosi TaxID=1544695 RepID=UPI0008F97174|nr:shikimate kinase AroL [Rosenbergiella collisarenosi]MBT0721538.1 shikimate kinase AroL [Rosenbergiella collisarenosi]QGX90823.1 shikimate kinase AroL [Tatumella sp. TA1]
MSFPVYLIGARGCGKTTVGKLLARQLSYQFCDTDQQLQQHLDQSIAEFVAQHGWETFRQQEHQALLTVTSDNTVVATGGGIVLRDDNRQHMRQSGAVIWLSVDHQVLASRLTADPEMEQRPTLTGRPITEEIYEVLQQRLPLYQQAAHHCIDANQPPEKVVIDILTALSRDSLTA